MELVQPGLGLIVWMTVAFALLIWILGKFAWKPIMRGLKERENSIDEALNQANKAREEMKELKFSNEQLMKEAKEERDNILREARKVKYDGPPIKFMISPRLLTEILKRTTDCVITKDRLVIDGGKFTYVGCLGQAS